MKLLTKPPPVGRRGAREATTIALDCSSSRRSLSGSSWFLNISIRHHMMVAMVAKASRKNIAEVSTITSHPDIGDLADHQNAHTFGNDGVGQKLAARGIGVQQPDVLRFQDPEAERDHQRHTA